MTPNQKRIAIAKACGWKFEPSKERQKHGYLICPNRKVKVTLWADGEIGNVDALPDYLNSRDAMETAVASLNENGLHDYIILLSAAFWPMGWKDWRDTAAIESATAAQRADAFLRSLQL